MSLRTTAQTALLAAATLWLCCAPTGTAQDAAKLLEAKLEPYIELVMAAQEVPGLAIGVVKDGEVIYAKGFGVRNLDTHEPMTADSLFHMASISKPFVATAVMQLVEQGKVDLDAPVVSYLPYFKLADEHYKQITVRQMLSHTSGMPDVDDYGWGSGQDDDGALERYVRSLADRTLMFDPGTRFSYSNMAYEVLGDLVAKVSGRTFESYIKEHILNPLGMVHSTFLRSEVPAELATSPHLRLLVTEASPVYPYNRSHAPSSTLHSSVPEMCNWAKANLNRGELGGTHILKKESYEQMWKQQTPASRRHHHHQLSVGLSWFLGDYRGHKAVFHSGGDIGYTSNLILLPDDSIAVVAMCNEMPSPVRLFSFAALDVLLGNELEIPRPPVTIVLGRTIQEKGFEAAAGQLAKLSAENAAEYDFSPGQFFMVAHGLLESDRSEEALTFARMIITALPKESGGYKLLAYIHQERGEIEEAVRALESALEIDPDSKRVKHELQWLKELRDKRK